jgi:hypothetical protein
VTLSITDLTMTITITTTTKKNLIGVYASLPEMYSSIEKEAFEIRKFFSVCLKIFTLSINI